MGIWRNIGKIVILLFQIVYEQMKWTLRSFKRVKRISPTGPSHSNNKREHVIKNIYRSTSNLSEEQESLERSKLMVELCEQPHLPTSDNELDW